MQAPPPRMCGLCHRVLSTAQNSLTGAVSYHHSRDDEHADHEPMPVPLGDVPVTGRCDFCSGENPQWEMVMDDFATFAPGVPLQVSCGNWAMCRTCRGFIEKGDWRGLADWSAAALGQMHGRVISRAEREGMRELHKILVENKGRIIPLQPF